ncbi:MAG: galactokinase, partial [Calditrichaeota bacterium]|nr:galactokinase [Calditrichota bacterium]
VHAPGRTNLIGEHTDYNGYPVMPMAINRDILVCASAHEKNVINISNIDEQFAARSFSIDENIQPYAGGDWGNYVKAAIAGLLPIVREKNGHAIGFNAVYSGIIPPAGGLSSSSAMVVASALTFLHANNVEIPKIELAEILARAERFVGTEGGGMDQAISLVGEKNKAVKIDFFPLRAVPLSLPKNYEIVICNSLVRAPKTEAAMLEYNRRPVECRLAAALIAKNLENISAHRTPTQRLVDVDQHKIGVDGQTFEKAVIQALNPPVLSAEQVREKLALSQNDLNEKYLRLKSGKLFVPPADGFKVGLRYEHVLSEAHRVEQAAQALQSGDVAEFGKLMNASHESCRSNYEISTPELDKLVEIARDHGAIGARLTGAGFGGCTVNLVPQNDVDAFIQGVIKDYYQDYLPAARPDIQFKEKNLKSIIFSSSAVAGAEVMEE